MALGNRQSTADKVPPELAPYYTGRSPRRWLGWLIRGVVVVVLLVLLSLFAVWGWHQSNTAKTVSKPKTSTSHQTTSKSPTTSKSTTPAKQTPSTVSVNPAAGSSNPSVTLPGDGTASSTPATSQPTTTTTPKQTTTTAIPSTGPNGEVAVFAVATTAGVVLYQLRLRRKFIN